LAPEPQQRKIDSVKFHTGRRVRKPGTFTWSNTSTREFHFYDKLTTHQVYQSEVLRSMQANDRQLLLLQGAIAISLLRTIV